MADTNSGGGRPPGRKGGWIRAGLAALAVFLIYFALALFDVVPQTGAWGALWVPFAIVAGWLGYRGTI
jgi:hypothetical protein